MTQWLIPVVIALFGSMTTYFIAVRKASGRIATTEAADLWKEAGNLRDAYRDEVQSLQERVEHLESAIGMLREENRALRKQNQDLADEVTRLASENAKLRELIDDVQAHYGGG